MAIHWTSEDKPHGRPRTPRTFRDEDDLETMLFALGVFGIIAAVMIAGIVAAVTL